MLIYRKHRGTFDAWRRYRVTVDGRKHFRLADGELKEIEGSDHSLNINAGPYSVRDISLETNRDQVVLIGLSANPKSEEPKVLAKVISASDAIQEVLRFDKPPYASRKKIGLLQAIGATLLMGLAAIGLFVYELNMIYSSTKPVGNFTVAFLIPVFLVGPAILMFFSLSGVRSLYYYFRMPKQWRN